MEIFDTRICFKIDAPSQQKMIRYDQGGGGGGTDDLEPFQYNGGLMYHVTNKSAVISPLPPLLLSG